MFELVYKTHFAAAHNLREYEGNCENLHGHNWKIDVMIKSTSLDDLGMLIDFRDVKRMVEGILDTLDHRYLNEIEPFTKINPTTENIARFISDELTKLMPEGTSVAGVTAWESDNCGVTYRDN